MNFNIYDHDPATDRAILTMLGVCHTLGVFATYPNVRYNAIQDRVPSRVVKAVCVVGCDGLGLDPEGTYDLVG